MRYALAFIASCAFFCAGSADATARSVYVLGDSYTVLMQRQGLDTAIPGWTVFSAGRGGRNIQAAPSPTGMQQVYKDRARIARSQTAVVELGTNLGDRTYFVSRLRNLIARIRSYNPAIRVLWVEPGNFAVAAQAIHAQRVRDVNALAPRLGLGVVHWRAVALAHPEWFAADPDGKHPDVAGTRALIGMIREAVTG